MSPVKVAVITLVMAAGTATHVTAQPATACGAGLPSTQMTFLDAKIERSEEVLEPRDLAAAAVKLGGHSGVGFLMVDPSVRGWLSIEHRVLPSPTNPTAFCDAPYRIRLALGYGKRRLLVTPKVASESCVMDALRAHEELHAQLEDHELGLFIDAQTPAVSAAMAKLKNVPAPSAEAAKSRFEAAGLPLVRMLEQGLLTRKAQARREVDTHEERLTMAHRCNGAIGLLDTRFSQAI